MHRLRFSFILLLGLALGLAACLPPLPEETPTPDFSPTPANTATPLPTATPTRTPTATPTPTPIPGTRVEVSVASSLGDVNEDGDKFVFQDRTLWFGNGEVITNSLLGLRFTNVPVPPKAIIHYAQLEFYTPAETWIPLQLTIAAEAIGNSTPFTDTARPSQRPLTSVVVEHESNERWVEGQWHTLAPVGELVQTIISRADWASGNSLSLILTGTGAQWSRKFAASYDADPHFAPRLVVYYSAP